MGRVGDCCGVCIDCSEPHLVHRSIHKHVRTHTHTHTHIHTRTPKPSSLIREWVYGLHSESNVSFSFFPFIHAFTTLRPLARSLGLSLRTEENISNNTSRFLLKRHFLFFPCFFILFSLQNMYRLFRTTTKIQYPIYMQF